MDGWTRNQRRSKAMTGTDVATGNGWLESAGERKREVCGRGSGIREGKGRLIFRTTIPDGGAWRERDEGLSAPARRSGDRDGSSCPVAEPTIIWRTQTWPAPCSCMSTLTRYSMPWPCPTPAVALLLPITKQVEQPQQPQQAHTLSRQPPPPVSTTPSIYPRHPRHPHHHRYKTRHGQQPTGIALRNVAPRYVTGCSLLDEPGEAGSPAVDIGWHAECSHRAFPSAAGRDTDTLTQTRTLTEHTALLVWR